MPTRGLALVAILLAHVASAQTAGAPSVRAALQDLQGHAEWRRVFDGDRERPTLVLLVSPT